MNTEINEAARERMNRIRLSLAAYAYEFDNRSIMSDAEFDDLSRRIRPEMSTIESYHVDPRQIERYKILDQFFKTEFEPDTGMWIRKHPELDRLEALYRKIGNQI